MNKYQRQNLSDTDLVKEIKATKDTLEGTNKYDPDYKILQSILKYLLIEHKSRLEAKQLKLF